VKKIFQSMLIGLVLVLMGCKGNKPGPLEGTWSMTDPIPMTIVFRSGETESMGMIEKVSYKTEGNDVLVTYEDGMAKGTTFRYTLVDANTVQTDAGTLRRIHLNKQGAGN
jgi:hypothetical protein